MRRLKSDTSLVKSKNHFFKTKGFFFAVVILWFVAIGVLPGCTGKANPYPEAKVTTPVGKPGKCAFCKKKFDSVEKKKLFDLNGIRYTLCDEKCAEQMKEWLKHQ